MKAAPDSGRNPEEFIWLPAVNVFPNISGRHDIGLGGMKYDVIHPISELKEFRVVSTSRPVLGVLQHYTYITHYRWW